MSDKNLNDFFGDELDKQEEQRREAMSSNNPQGFDFDEEQRRRSMYYGIPEYQGQQKYVQRKSKGKTALLITLGALAMVVVFFLGYCTFLFANPDLKFINDVLNLVNENAYIWDESEDKYQRDYAYQAAKAILNSIDQYSTLLTPEEYYELMNSVESSNGISNGLTYTVDDDGSYVIYEVAIGSPAYEAGLFPRDKVVRMTVSGNTDGLPDGSVLNVGVATPVDEFKKYIHSQAIEFTVEREGATVDGVRVVASPYYISTSVEYYFGASNTNMSAPYKDRIDADSLPADTGYIRLTTFMDTTAPQAMASAMAKFKAAGKSKLIFDLSGNGGGRSDVAAEIASYFVYDKSNPSSASITVSVDKDKDNKVIKSETTQSVYGGYFDTSASTPRIAVLTDGGSASASEMLLGAMLDYGTAVQVGAKTYGKGIAQGVIPFKAAKANINGVIVDSYWAAYMTYVKFFTPVSDICHHGTGFTPSADNTAQTYSQKMTKAISALS